jgi:hypothetical protein
MMNFADEYDVSIDWLLSGEGVQVSDHLAKRSGRKVVILPAVGPRGRQMRLRALK